MPDPNPDRVRQHAALQHRMDVLHDRLGELDHARLDDLGAQLDLLAQRNALLLEMGRLVGERLATWPH